MILLNRVALAGTLLAVAAVPVRAEVTKVEVTGKDVKGACPNQVLFAKGLIQVNQPSTIVYYWQYALWPPNSTGQQRTMNQPPISHKFTAPGSINVTSLPLGVPKGFSGLFRLVAERYVSGSITHQNNCQGRVTGMGANSVYDSSRCKDGIVLLQTYIDTVEGPVTIRYVPILNGYKGQPESKTFPTPGHQNFAVSVRTTKSQPATVSWAIVDPVAMTSKTFPARTCPAVP